MKTGTESSQARWDLFDSFAFLTGGAWRPPPTEEWQRIDAVLKQNGYSGMEYGMWVIYYTPVGKTKGRAALKFKSWLVKEATLSAFLDWKRLRKRDIKNRVIRQMKAFSSFLNLGYTMEEMCMKNYASASSIVIIELLLRASHGTSRDVIDKVMEKYANKAFEVAMGCPEYVWYCPHVAEDLEKGEASELRRQIRKLGGSTTPPV